MDPPVKMLTQQTELLRKA